MKDQIEKGTSRRSVLQGIGATGGLAVLGSPFGLAGVAEALDSNCREVTDIDCSSLTDCPQRAWTCSDRWENTSEGVGYIEQGTSLVWYDAIWHPNRDGGRWLHDMALNSNFCGRWDSSQTGITPSSEIGGQYYDMSLARPDTWTIDVNGSANYFGVYPHSGANDILPDSVELVADLGLGALNPGAAFILAVDDFTESLSDNNGVSSTSDGWELTHHPSYFEDRWTDCTQFQRFFVEAPAAVVPGVEHFEVTTGCNYGHLGNTATEKGFSFTFGQDTDDSPSVSSMPIRDDGKVDLNPENMSQTMKDEFGIEKLDDESSVGSNSAENGAPKYVAKNFPMTVSIN